MVNRYPYLTQACKIFREFFELLFMVSLCGKQTQFKIIHSKLHYFTYLCGLNWENQNTKRQGRSSLHNIVLSHVHQSSDILYYVC